MLCIFAGAVGRLRVVRYLGEEVQEKLMMLRKPSGIEEAADHPDRENSGQTLYRSDEFLDVIHLLQRVDKRTGSAQIGLGKPLHDAKQLGNRQLSFREFQKAFRQLIEEFRTAHGRIAVVEIPSG